MKKQEIQFTTIRWFCFGATPGTLENIFQSHGRQRTWTVALQLSLRPLCAASFNLKIIKYWRFITNSTRLQGDRFWQWRTPRANHRLARVGGYIAVQLSSSSSPNWWKCFFILEFLKALDPSGTFVQTFKSYRCRMISHRTQLFQQVPATRGIPTILAVARHLSSSILSAKMVVKKIIWLRVYIIFIS